MKVTCRHGRCDGYRIGRAAAYEFRLSEQLAVRPEYPDRVQRAFVLLDEHIQLNQPIIETSYWDGWWYIDLADVTEDGDSIEVGDQYIDLIVPPDVRPYRVLDLDDFADALDDNRLAPDRAADGLRRLQAFLDAHLHVRERHHDEWADFPPRAIRALQALDQWCA